MPKEKTFSVTCYGETRTYKESERNKIIKFYREAYNFSDGHERARYMNILLGLFDGCSECKDE